MVDLRKSIFIFQFYCPYHKSITDHLYTHLISANITYPSSEFRSTINYFTQKNLLCYFVSRSHNSYNSSLGWLDGWLAGWLSGGLLAGRGNCLFKVSNNWCSAFLMMNARVYVPVCRGHVVVVWRQNASPVCGGDWHPEIIISNGFRII